LSLSPQLRQQVLASVASKPAPTRAQATRARLALFAAGIAGAIAIFFLKGGVRMTGRPPTLVALTSFGTAVVGGVGMYLLFTRRGRSMLRRPWTWMAAAALASTIGFLVWKVGISSIYGMAQQWPGRIGFKCLRLGIMTGALPLFAALASWRGTDPLTPAATGAAFGAGAGLGSALLVDLWCPVAYLPHLLLGHVLPIAVLAGLGAFGGWRILRVRRR
jgi:hypothetical protein